MQRIVIIGAGGHGREVAEILHDQARQRTDISVLGFVDDDPGCDQPRIDDLPLLGGWSWFQGVDRNEIAVICAVGLPEVRQQLVERAMASGLSFANAISPSAYLSPDARVGQGVMLFPGSVASTNALLGDHVIINLAATISHDTRVGNYGTINPGVHLAGNVSIAEGCYLGLGANVIHGVSIGEWTVVGAGAVVIDDLPAHVTAVGVPARVKKTREKESH